MNMNLLKQKSIRNRFTLGLVAIITGIVLLFSMALIFYNSRSVEEQLNDKLNKIMNFAAESLPTALWHYNNNYVIDYIESLFQYEDIVFASVMVKDEVVVKKSRQGDEKHPFSYFKESVKYISVEEAITYKDVTVGILRLVISRERIRELVISTSSLSLVILFVVNLLVLYLNYYMSNWYLFNPLSELENSVKAISRGELDVKIDTSGEDEIGQLARSFDQMMINLKIVTASRDDLNKEIVDRKQAEKELRNNEEKFRALFEQSGGYCMILDPNTSDGIPLIVEANNEACLAHGYQPEEFIGRPVADIDSEAEKPLVKQRTNEIMTGKPFYCEIEHVRKDGTTFFVAVNAKRIDIGDGPPLILTTEYDITERKKLESKLIQAQKMEAIGILAGGIAHDFNNILTAIMGFSDLILADVKKGSTMEGDILEIVTAAKRARDLINQVLVFARQTDEKLIPMRLDMVANEVLKLIRSSIPTSIEIKSKIESKSRIEGNPTQCHQIFMNLCTNAAYAMENEGGILEISVRDIDIKPNASIAKGDLSPGEYVKIAIKDTGVGIPNNIIKSIFDPYFTTKPPGEGTGLGLSVVHGIVESYGGKILVDSMPNIGTEFTIFIPIVKRSEKHVSEQKQDLPKGTEHILVVDDEIAITKVLSRTLQQLGYSITRRNSSLEALELFKIKPNHFDLVITDMTMPNMTGDKLAIEIISIRPSIPVILCTGYSKNITTEKVLETGIRALVHKPIINADLARTIRTVLDDKKTGKGDNIHLKNK